MILLKKPPHLALMREAGKRLHEVLNQLKEAVRPGITTIELNELAEKLILASGSVPSFKGYNGFPFTLCTSVDYEVVHGMPNDIQLTEGQILSIDAGLIYQGWQADSAFTIGIGSISSEAQQLIDVTERSFWLGVAKATTNNRLGDISNAIQQHAESYGYGVIRAMCGHGIGQKLHEDPEIPNYGEAGTGVKLRPGMTLAIEPMISAGDYRLDFSENKWTCMTRDRSLCSHYEHTIAITDGEPEILTFPGVSISEVLS